MFRRHELNAGFGTERENLALDAKEMTSGKHHEEPMTERVTEPSIVAKKLL